MQLELLIGLCVCITYAGGNCQHTTKAFDRTRLTMSARYLMHKSDWTTMATESRLSSMEGFPFLNLKIVSDGPTFNSTGIPYVLITDFDTTMKDLKANPRATMMFSMPESDLCEKTKNPYDLKCIKLMLTGKMSSVPEDTMEYEFARTALLERHHRIISSTPISYVWFILKMKISHVAIVNWFGDIKYIPLHQYLGFRYPGNDYILKYLTVTSMKHKEINSIDDKSGYLDKFSEYKHHTTTEKAFRHEDIEHPMSTPDTENLNSKRSDEDLFSPQLYEISLTPTKVSFTASLEDVSSHSEEGFSTPFAKEVNSTPFVDIDSHSLNRSFPTISFSFASYTISPSLSYIYSFATTTVQPTKPPNYPSFIS